jgi:gliding motility-associated-like protein
MSKKLNHLKKFLLLLFLLISAGSISAAPIKLIPNKGQWESNVLYRADIPGGKFYIENNRLTYFFYDEGTLHKVVHQHPANAVINCHVVKVNFVNTTGVTSITAENQGSETYNYFHGNDPSKWASNLHPAGDVILHDVWPGIDMKITANDQSLKYTFIVQPGADPSQIKLDYTGASSINVKDGLLNVLTTLTNIQEQKPVAFSERKGGITDVPAEYTLTDSVLSFKLGHYSRKAVLTIDPTLIFSTFSGSVADNFGFTGTYNKNGNGFSGGTVYDYGYPTTTGAFQQTWHGGYTNYDKLQFACDDGIIKYSPDGTKLLWATYIGGSNNEQPHSMIVNSKGNLVILGTTNSPDFPVTSNAYDKSFNGNWDIYVLILKDDGSALVSSTFYGGSSPDGLNGTDIYNYPTGDLSYNYGDAYRGEVLVDNQDNILISSTTQSTNIPVVNAYQSNLRGAQDALLARFSPDLSTLQFATYYGGSSQDAGYGINMDNFGNIFITGGTESTDVPMAGSPKWRNNQGGIDGYIAKFSPDGRNLLASTYVGTNKYDQSYFVQVDNYNRIYVTGQTLGEFPVVGSVFHNSGARQFIATFDDDLNKLLISTTFGSGPRGGVNLSPSAFLVDLCGRVYVSGWGGDDNLFYNPDAGNTFNMPITADAFQKGTDGSDFYLIILGREMKSLVYGTYYGGAKTAEHVDGGTSRFDRDGKVYQSVCGGCGGFSDMPTTPNAWSRTNNAHRPGHPEEGGCNNAMFKLDLNSSNFAPAFKDVTLVVPATTLINYDFRATDADETDSVVITYKSEILDPKSVSPVGTITVNNGVGVATGHLTWQTNCGERDRDTFVVYLTIRDNGCPTPRITLGKIKIVVTPPPLPPPPAIFCLERIDNNTVKLNWDEMTLNQFVANYKLIKVNPDGTEKILKNITSSGDKTYTDNEAINHNINNYQYYLYGTNVCGDTGYHTRMISSLPDPDSIPKPVNIYTVTVENNKYVKVEWSHYKKADFYTYLIYRRENTPGMDYTIYKSLKNYSDTTFTDSNVDVQAKSYSYKIIVRNQCGLQSATGNPGCSILLTGNAVPFENHLAFNDYKQWTDGVYKYEIVRWDPSKSDSVVGFILNPSANRQNETYVDDSLNYDMGLYYYRIVAYELNGGRAVSVSNDIKLIQKPIVYIPNVFTPNKDGINDLWGLSKAFVKDYHLQVYNRWGEKVWDTTNKHDAWDGTFKGHVPFDDVFIYMLEYTGWDNSRNFRKGNVTLLN